MALDGPLDGMHFHNNGDFTLLDSQYVLAHVLREPGQQLLYRYDLGDKWDHIIELEQVMDDNAPFVNPASGSDCCVCGATGASKLCGKCRQAKYCSSKCQRRHWTDGHKECCLNQGVLSGVRLIGGAFNCPPEDSSSSTTKTLLAKGPDHYDPNSAMASNWKENGVRNIYAFDLGAHARRLRAAISDKASAKHGYRKHTTFFSRDAADAHINMADHTANADGSTESVRTRPDTSEEACCFNCGKPEQSSAGGLFRCSGCKVSWYCSLICQKAHWKLHKSDCRANQVRFDARLQEAINAVRVARSRIDPRNPGMADGKLLLQQARGHKTTGDEYYGIGEFKMAATAYTMAIDALNQKPADDAQFGAARGILSDCILSRADCRLQRAAAARASPVVCKSLVRMAHDDCNATTEGHGYLPGTGKKARMLHMASELDDASEDAGRQTPAITLPMIVEGHTVGFYARFCAEECPICYEAWDGRLVEADVVALECGHAICKECLAGYCAECKKSFKQETSSKRLRTSWVCPVCREDIGDVPTLS